MPDRLFADPRLAAIYDDVNRDRTDLDHYEAIVTELGASSVVDVGCGTGVLACRLADKGLDVTGVDPAGASLDVGRAKRPGGLVTWLEGVAADLPPLGVDVATMTGNVAQVFTSDEDWHATLAGIRGAVRDGGHLVFESRDPAFRVWEEWKNRPSSLTSTSAGPVEYSIEVTAVDLPYVSFRLTYQFQATGLTLTSDTTLRFRQRSEIEEALTSNGFDVAEVRDAPDRPGREFVFITQASAGVRSC
jgi:SAM-dependent methyltransferase